MIILELFQSEKLKKTSIKASEFDSKFDNGEDISEFLDLENVIKPANKPKRVSIDFPEWMVLELDKVSKRLGVTRQSVIKVFISEKLKEKSL
ncbi:CopG family transcriptional regulator [Marivirga sp.]|uniref:type II toxin-antitoxin system BrnA family antitoxin n=1 Tax=Marivirga sp. TaxID=2018662 RepID=UPI0025F28EDC|nr:CopG family transcriptional regulator [Marivirga sp.]